MGGGEAVPVDQSIKANGGGGQDHMEWEEWIEENTHERKLHVEMLHTFLQMKLIETHIELLRHCFIFPFTAFV